ncbi:MAG: hypothetical protein K2Q01_10535, partial [Rickettsiales bacterium]|nr:hypothetical protein [Rickettsiales bacterium]
MKRFRHLSTKAQRRAVWALWLAASLYILLSSWVSEDAYITLRVVDNFFRGYGLRWNVHERVQVYTHPLWLLLHIPLRVFIPNLFIVSIVLNFVATAAALFVTLYFLPRRLSVTVLAFFVPMWASKAFFDYSSSGLENGLFYVLYAAFGIVCLRFSAHPRFWFMVSLVVALSLFNRLDTVIFFAPALCWLVWERFWQIRWKQVALGALPLLGWFAFSLFYYGFVFPNTKGAKLDTGLPVLQYLTEGWHYLRYLMVMDIPSFLLLLAGPVAVWATVRRGFASMLALGVVMYCLYIVNIGGDYMMGRFWAFPVFACIWLLYVFLPEGVNVRALAAAALVLVVTSGPVMRPVRAWCAACSLPKG